MSRPSKNDVGRVVSWLERHGTKANREGMARYGIPSDKAFGVSVGILRRYAKSLCDTVCIHLFDRTPHAWRKVKQWSRAVAQRLSASPNPAARWVGTDAVRELTSPAVRRRLAGRRRSVA